MGVLNDGDKSADSDPYSWSRSISFCEIVARAVAWIQFAFGSSRNQQSCAPKKLPDSIKSLRINKLKFRII